jgi:hypothetical protein
MRTRRPVSDGTWVPGHGYPELASQSAAAELSRVAKYPIDWHAWRDIFSDVRG